MEERLKRLEAAIEALEERAERATEKRREVYRLEDRLNGMR
jgi:hypothetical protein